MPVTKTSIKREKKCKKKKWDFSVDRRRMPCSAVRSHVPHFDEYLHYWQKDIRNHVSVTLCLSLPPLASYLTGKRAESSIPQ